MVHEDDSSQISDIPREKAGPKKFARTIMHQFFKGPFFNFESVRLLGTARYGGAEVAEVLEAIGEIQDNDPASWHEAWAQQANNAESLAIQALNLGHNGAARMGFLRASNYTRASAYMMTSATPKTSHPTVPKILRKAGELFQQAMALANGPVHRLQIPYQDGLHLPAYLHLPPLTRRLTGRIPLIINPGGADSIQEEIFYMFPAEGPELGYAVLTFDGPGQGPILHEHDVPMRPDWEVVSNAVFDFIVQYGSEHEDLELDFDRVAIAGASLGAYFALRSMDADPRYKVCIAIDPIYDLFDFATQHVSPRLLQYWSQGLVPDAVVDNIVWAGMQISFQTKWEIITSARFLGVSTPTDILRAMKPFTLKTRPGQLGIGRPECATFVSGAAGSLYLDFEAHTTKIFDQLASRDKELWVATTPGQGSLQAKMGAMAYCNQRAFAFLDQRFDMKRDF